MEMHKRRWKATLAAACLAAAMTLPSLPVCAADPAIVTKSNFDYAGYLAKYPDLQQYYTADQEDAIWDFYRNTGEPNGWNGDILPQKLITESNFDWERYAADYLDVAQALNNDPDAMYWHFINTGYAEGRKGYSRNDLENARLLIYETAHRITNDTMSDRDKIKAVHDWIIINTKYDYDNYLKGTIPSDDYSYAAVMLRHTGVCEGYANTFQYFMQVLDIPCGVVSSNVHAWNKVKLDNTWYYIDVTWDDPVPDRGGQVYWYRYYLSTDPTFGGEPSHVVLRDDTALWGLYD